MDQSFQPSTHPKRILKTERQSVCSIPDSSDSPLSLERVDDSPSSGFSGPGYDSSDEDNAGCTS